MALETSRFTLVKHLREASAKLAVLDRVMADHPPHDDAPALVNQLVETALDGRGQIEDALESAANLAAVQGGAALTEAARTTLPLVQQAIHRALFECLLKLASPGNSSELARIARMRRGEWAGWATAIRPVLAESVRVLEPAHASLGECWCDLFDRTGGAAPRINQVVNICHRDPELTPAHLEPISPAS